MREPSSGMLAPERRVHILAALARDGIVKVTSLSEELGVTPVTLRRDLAQLEVDGLVLRVHGGAIPAHESEVAETAALPPVSARPAAGRDAIGILVPSLNYYWPTVVRGAEQEAERLGYRLLIRGASYELQDERPLLERLVEDDGVVGLIVAPNTAAEHADEVLEWLHRAPVPAVLVEREGRGPDMSPMESASSDHALGGMLAARHLASLGHERIALVLSRSSPTSGQVAAGWSEACRELGLPESTGVAAHLPDRNSPDFSSVVAATLDDALEHGVTGMLVHPDPEALAFVDVAMTRGISVPEDLSVIAYDDEVARMFTPAFTAVAPPRTAVGRTAVGLLHRRITEPDVSVERAKLSPSLSVRASTAPPRTA